MNETNGQIIFDIKKLKKQSFSKRTTTIEAPELNEVMGVEEGETVAFKVQAGTLDDILKSKTMIDQETSAVALRILSEARDKATKTEKVNMDKISADLEALMGLSERTQFEVELVQKCLLEPLMTIGDVRWLSENFPFLITKLSTTIMNLTVQGSVSDGSRE